MKRDFVAVAEALNVVFILAPTQREHTRAFAETLAKDFEAQQRPGFTRHVFLESALAEMD